MPESGQHYETGIFWFLNLWPWFMKMNWVAPSTPFRNTRLSMNCTHPFQPLWRLCRMGASVCSRNECYQYQSPGDQVKTVNISSVTRTASLSQHTPTDLLLGHFISFVFLNQSDSPTLMFIIQLKIYDSKRFFPNFLCRKYIYIYKSHVIIFLDLMMCAVSGKDLLLRLIDSISYLQAQDIFIWAWSFGSIR